MVHREEHADKLMVIVSKHTDDIMNIFHNVIREKYGDGSNDRHVKILFIHLITLMRDMKRHHNVYNQVSVFKKIFIHSSKTHRELSESILEIFNEIRESFETDTFMKKDTSLIEKAKMSTNIDTIVLDDKQVEIYNTIRRLLGMVDRDMSMQLSHVNYADINSYVSSVRVEVTNKLLSKFYDEIARACLHLDIVKISRNSDIKICIDDKTYSIRPISKDMNNKKVMDILFENISNIVQISHILVGKLKITMQHKL